MRMPILAVPICLASTLGACVSTGDPSVDRVALGAAGGALVGQVVGGDTGATLVGAVLGGMLGGATAPGTAPAMTRASSSGLTEAQVCADIPQHPTEPDHAADLCIERMTQLGVW